MNMNPFNEIRKTIQGVGCAVFFLLALQNATAFPGGDTPSHPKDPAFQPAQSKALPYAGPETIQELNASIPKEYLLGPGDLVDVQVWEQPKLSGQQTIGPDGMVALQLIGPVEVQSLTRTQAAAALQKAFEKYYREPIVTLQVLEYKNNRAFVMGRVERPGLIRFDGQGTLLELLAMAGSQPVDGPGNRLEKCAVIRGKDKIVWIDLDELLLGGNMSLNINIANNDVVYIPDEQDAMVYVMGEVLTPGAYRLTPQMSFLDGLMGAGGPSEDARKGSMALVRNIDGKAHVLKVSLRDFKKGNYANNIELQENDIIFVSRKGLAHLNYVLRQLSPFATLAIAQDLIADD